MHVESIGNIEHYPVYLVHMRGHRDHLPAILLTAGVHGNEPSGVEATLRFLGSDQNHLRQRFQFCVLPCINPVGYVRDTRENGQGIDINRAFEEDDIPEVQLVKRGLGDRQFLCGMDFHEDWEATGFYLYEGRHEGPNLGENIVKRLSAIGPMEPDDDERDEDDPPQSPGVYPVATSWGTQGLTSYTYAFHAAHTLISEAPTSWEFERRVSVHLTLLDTVLTHYLGIVDR